MSAEIGAGSADDYRAFLLPRYRRELLEIATMDIERAFAGFQTPEFRLFDLVMVEETGDVGRIMGFMVGEPPNLMYAVTSYDGLDLNFYSRKEIIGVNEQ